MPPTRRLELFAEPDPLILRIETSLHDEHGLEVTRRAEFTAHTDPIERYLALLAWCALNYAGDFADFISHQESGLRYLALNRDEINEARSRNHARQIDGTQYWAIMNIDTATKRRFLARVLEFIGYRDTVTEFVCSVIGMKGGWRRGRFAALMA